MHCNLIEQWHVFYTIDDLCSAIDTNMPYAKL